MEAVLSKPTPRIARPTAYKGETSTEAKFSFSPLTRHHHLHDVPLADLRAARLGDELGLPALALLFHRHL